MSNFDHPDYDEKMFRSPEFAEANLDIFKAYVTARVNGHMPSVAFRRAFGPGYRSEDTYKFAEQVEHNPWFAEAFATALAAMPMDKLWNNKIAINALRQLTLDAYTKCSTKLAAMKELNVLANITFVDETGRTRANRNLNDFYASLPTQDAETEAARASALAAAGIKAQAPESGAEAPGESGQEHGQDTPEGQAKG
jgi:hypothetical protein